MSQTTKLANLPPHVWDLCEVANAKKKLAAREKFGAAVCSACFKPPADPSVKLLFCSKCTVAGQTVGYCSRECQFIDWKDGSPPHKQLCGKTLRSVDFGLASETPVVDDFPLYTTSPSPKLALQLFYLRRDGPKWDYNWTGRADGLPGQKAFHGEFKDIFIKARARAMAERDLASVGMMEVLFKSVAGELDRPLLWIKQLEQEYECRIRDCRKAAKERGGKEWDFVQGIMAMVAMQKIKLDVNTIVQ